MENHLVDALLAKFTHSQSDLETLVDEIGAIIDQVHRTDFTQLSEEKKIEADLLVLYAINSLYFVNLRVNHIESDFVKTELKRVQEAMKRFKTTKDKLTIMPRLDKDASKRFVRNALWTPAGKKTRFDEDGNVIEKNETMTDS